VQLKITADKSNKSETLRCYNKAKQNAKSMQGQVKIKRKNYFYITYKMYNLQREIDGLNLSINRKIN